MYEKGLLELVDPPCATMDEDGYCEDYEHVHRISDSRASGNNGERRINTAYLPHSCDDWVIGVPEEILALIEDLQEAVKAMREQT